MTSRYAYWRKPTGSVSIDPKFAPQAYLRDCGPKLRPGENGGASWQLEPIVDNLLMVLRGAIQIKDPDSLELNEQDSWQLARRGLINFVQKGGGGQAIDPIALLDEINLAAAQFFQLPTKKFVIVGTLSVADFPAKAIRINGGEIRPLKKRGRYRYPDAPELRPGAALRKHLDASKYRHIAIHVQARSTSDAFANGIRSVDILRGVWTLNVRPGRQIFPLTLQSHPVGVIHHGPVHTIHDANGRVIPGVYWKSSNYQEWDLFRMDDGWAKIEKVRKWALRRLRTSPIGAEIGELLARYAGALDQLDFEIAFLHLWAVLERLTSTTGESYDETVRRASWLFEDRDHVKELLECGRLRRNRYVHSSQSAGNTDELVHTMKEILDRHLVSLMRGDFGNRSLEEIGRILALAPDAAQLRIGRNRYSTAIKLLTRSTRKPKESQQPSMIWYACYGSNLNSARFLCYIKGGTPPGSDSNYAGSRDKTLPQGDQAYTIPWHLFFSKSSSTWMGGGVAFLDVNRSGATLGRLYRITFQQFEDVYIQENALKHTVLPILPSESDLIACGETVVGEVGWYRKVKVLARHANGEPIFTFTSPSGPEETKPPTHPYLTNIAKGLRETYPAMDSVAIAAYISQLDGLGQQIAAGTVDSWLAS